MSNEIVVIATTVLSGIPAWQAVKCLMAMPEQKKWIAKFHNRGGNEDALRSLWTSAAFCAAASLVCALVGVATLTLRN